MAAGQFVMAAGRVRPGLRLAPARSSSLGSLLPVERTHRRAHELFDDWWAKLAPKNRRRGVHTCGRGDQSSIAAGFLTRDALGFAIG